jgi:hypothetical protein
MGGTWSQDGQRFINEGSGRLDVYENGLGRDVGTIGPDGRVVLGYGHDHYWEDGRGSGFADRADDRDAMIRGLGRSAIRGS